MNVLVVAAHPDDEILGCGGAVARHAASGDTVWSLVLGEGISARNGLGRAEKARRMKTLRGDARRANKTLGVERLILLEFPDNRFDTVARLDVIQAIERVVAEFRPEIVYTHSEIDLNIDHQITSEAVRTACRPLPRSSVRRVLAFETASSTEWRFGSEGFQPTVFIDVSATLDRKLEALRAYRGEMQPFPHPRSEQFLRALAAVRGGQAGLEAAEAFVLVRDVS